MVCAAALWSLSASAQSAPVGDFHQHLFSPTLAALVSPAPPAAPFEPIDAKTLTALLDAAGISRAVVLSTAYIFSQPSRNVANDDEKVRAENDWTSAQVAQYPDRLIGFCGVNPLREYALAEIDRCARDRSLRYGVKLHFGNSVVDYHNPDHIARLKRVFQAANAHRMAIVVHMRPSVTARSRYGADEARIFLNELLPTAPDVVVQIAHLAGAGPFTDEVQQASGVFADAVMRGDPRMKNVWFDAGPVVSADTVPRQADAIAARIRQLGVSRILYGSDAATGGNLAPKAGWAAFRTLPLTEEEFRSIAANRPPYLP
jgi:predicted TIM-barrel fold metal-dependent hydrolase